MQNVATVAIVVIATFGVKSLPGLGVLPSSLPCSWESPIHVRQSESSRGLWLLSFPLACCAL